jgi:hypothetical protein
MPTLQTCTNRLRLRNLVKEIHNEIEYVADDGDYWQYPNETLERGKGDCEDFAILFMKTAYDRYGITTTLVLTVSSSGSGHASVMYEDHIYDPTWGKSFHKSHLKVIKYEILTVLPLTLIPLMVELKRYLHDKD